MAYTSSFDGVKVGLGQAIYDSSEPVSATIFDGVHDLLRRVSHIAEYAEQIEVKLNGGKPEDAQKQSLQGTPDGVLPRLRKSADEAAVQLDRIDRALRDIDRAING